MLHESLPSGCVPVCVSLLSLLSNDLANTFPRQRIVGSIIFYVVLVVLKESLWVCLCIPISLLGNVSVKSFPLRRRIFGGIAFYVARVVSKQISLLVLPRASFVSGFRGDNHLDCAFLEFVS
jgi:hypothetical protein